MHPKLLQSYYLMRMERAINPKYVKVVWFEDLVYKTNQTIEAICDFICLDADNHRSLPARFNPFESIKNTQIFHSKSEFKDECDIIEQQLSKYLYEFPYTLNNKIEEAWDA